MMAFPALFLTALAVFALFMVQQFTNILQAHNTHIICLSYNHHRNLKRRLTMKTLFRKTIVFPELLCLLALIAALGMAALPFVSASAAGKYDPPVPPQGQTSSERLERIWARQLRIYERIGNAFEREDAFMEKAQRLIERAKENGKDVSAVQAALDAFEAAVKDAHPIYESAKGIVNSHQGFDSTGKVADPAKAQDTVKAMREKLQNIKAAMNGSGRALREAIRAFREVNPRPQPTPES
jgi:phosphoserine phosphatase